jgi:hypothetical protein
LRVLNTHRDQALVRRCGRIHLGGQAAVVVPVPDFLRLRALEQAASAQELEDAEDKAALADWRAREAAGQTSYVPHEEALRRLGLAG